MATAAVTSGLSALLAGDNLRAKIAEMRKKAEATNAALTDTDEVIPEEFDYNSLIFTIQTSINGTRDLMEQKVQVQYLATDQLLLIPAGLAIDPWTPANSEATVDARTISTYKRALRMTYVEILELVNSTGTAAAKYATFCTRAEATAAPEAIQWELRNFYVKDDGTAEDPDHASVVMAVFSRLVRLNFDIRDMGVLVMDTAHMRVTDSAWSDLSTVTNTRLRPKLRPYTMDCIAGLNYEACGKWAIGAQVRAFGVSCGVLPASSTLLNKEWKFTRSVPDMENYKLAQKAYEQVGAALPTLCLNMIAMFGLLHLAKNHTFKSHDTAMDRICVSYVQTLRTMVDTTIIDDLKAHMEITCRTAAHPFGLGQTYWTAHALGKMNAIASPLALRLNVTPPPVQRFMIVEAAANEWSGLPIGDALNAVKGVAIEELRVEIAKIRTCPPAYSELWAYYGLTDATKASAVAMAKASSIMPLVCGYSHATHVDEQQKKDGLALAMSFSNVERDAKAQVMLFSTLWEAYLDNMNKEGLINFVRDHYRSERVGTDSDAGMRQ